MSTSVNASRRTKASAHKRVCLSDDRELYATLYNTELAIKRTNTVHFANDRKRKTVHKHAYINNSTINLSREKHGCFPNGSNTRRQTRRWSAKREEVFLEGWPAPHVLARAIKIQTEHRPGRAIFYQQFCAVNRSQN